MSGLRYLRTAEVPLAEIEVPPRLRPVDAEEVARLALSLGERGQQTPIEVVEQQQGRPYRLVAGAHRLAAATALGWETIRAEVKAAGKRAGLELELAEIDENLQRHELNPLDRAVFVGRRLKIEKQLRPERFGRGGDRRSPAVRSKPNDLDWSFPAEVAQLLGRSEELVRRSVRIYEGLGPELLQRLAGTPLARQEGELYQLTRYSPEQRAAIVENLLGVERPAQSVRQAAAVLEGAPAPAPQPHEVTLQRLSEAWRRGDRRGRIAFLDWLGELGVVQSYEREQC